MLFYLTEDNVALRRLTVILAFAGSILLANPSFSQSFQWAKQFGGDLGESRSVATDDFGNSYTTGFFGGTFDFDPGVGTFMLTSSSGTMDIFITKLDDEGNLVWAKKVGGAVDDHAFSIALDASGNVYATGQFGATADFDPGSGTYDQTAMAGAKDIFVIKLDNDGNFLWAKQFQGNADNYGYALTVDALGNVYTAGYFQYAADFDPGLGSAFLTATGIGGDIFVVKLDASGNLIWARQMGGSSNVIPSIDIAFSIAVDASGNVYTTGVFENTADFDPGAGVFNLTSNGYDAFISKLSIDGHFVWAKQLGGTSNEFGRAIAISSNGGVYATGHFEGTADFDPGPADFSLTSAGGNDIFTIQLDASGALVWATHQGGIDHDYAFALSLDSSDNVYTSGFFYGTSDFDPGSGTHNLSAAGSADLFVSKVDPSGNLIWAKKMGGSNEELGYSIDVNTWGKIRVVGPFSGTADFDPGVDIFELTCVGSSDMFVLAFNQCTPSATTHTLSACDSYTWIDGNTYTSSNNSATFLLTSKAGCDSLITLNLTIVTVETGVTINSSTLIAHAVGATYQWFNCDTGEDLENGNEQSFLPPTSGNYGVRISQNGCEATSICTPMIITDTVETPEGTIRVHPNPTSGQITLSFSEDFRYCQLIISNMLGQTLQQMEIIDRSTVDLRIEGEAGLYLLALTAKDGQTHHTKILKK